MHAQPLLAVSGFWVQKMATREMDVSRCVLAQMSALAGAAAHNIELTLRH
jgi:hypothetical protein